MRGHRERETPINGIRRSSTKRSRGLKAFRRMSVGKLLTSSRRLRGAENFSEGEEPPPAEWLCVFDKYRRYGEPGKLGSRVLEEGPDVDPFDLYHIDSDVPPAMKPILESVSRQPDAWDAFNLNHVDKTNLSNENFSVNNKSLGVQRTAPSFAASGLMGEWIREVPLASLRRFGGRCNEPPLHPED